MLFSCHPTFAVLDLSILLCNCIFILYVWVCETIHFVPVRMLMWKSPSVIQNYFIRCFHELIEILIVVKQRTFKRFGETETWLIQNYVSHLFISYIELNDFPGMRTKWFLCTWLKKWSGRVKGTGTCVHLLSVQWWTSELNMDK